LEDFAHVLEVARTIAEQSRPAFPQRLKLDALHDLWRRSQDIGNFPVTADGIHKKERAP
jgi:hypothetical protein